jgi:hypothetical protein
MNASARSGVDALFLCALLGCGSGSHTNDGPAVPDPGGPFRTSVESSRRIDSLAVVESDTLCRDVAGAFYAFLAGAVDNANTCGDTVTLSLEDPMSGRISADASAMCWTEYAQCLSSVPPARPFYCPLPLPGNSPCDATVEDLSACLNEMAALDPVGRCRMYPACDDASVGVDAALRPATAACDRLLRICPAFVGLATFPC